jgi:putative transposase
MRWVLRYVPEYEKRWARVVGFGVEPAHIDGIGVCRLFNHARRGQPLPKRLSSDHDPLFRFHRWRANLRILDIEELKSGSFVPRSHPFIEQLIGTLRREYLDQSFFWNGLDLHRSWIGSPPVTTSDVSMPDWAATHPSSDAARPCGCQPANLHDFAWQSDCSGLFHTPIAA